MNLPRGVSTRFTLGLGVPIVRSGSTRSRIVFFASDRDGGVFNLYQKVASGAKDEQLLIEKPSQQNSYQLVRDGRSCFTTRRILRPGNIVWVVPLDPDGRKRPSPSHLSARSLKILMPALTPAFRLIPAGWLMR